jgi:hypothetical protein
MTPKSSRDLPGQPPRKDTKRETEQATVEDADKTNDEDRDRVHGDGGEIGLDGDS